MSIKRLNPYLNYNGNAEKAIQHYERALGAKVESVMRFSDVQGMPVAEENKNRIMHAALRIGEGTIMVSDMPPGRTVAAGGSAHIVMEFTDVEDMTKKFNALAEGGTVTMPLQDTFWGATFGMLQDAYGIQWMFNAEKPA